MLIALLESKVKNIVNTNVQNLLIRFVRGIETFIHFSLLNPLIRILMKLLQVILKIQIFFLLNITI